jgi:glycosyltransferase involved in cell wall biosynthesis
MIRICTSLATNGYDVKLIGRELPHSQDLTIQPFKQKRLFCFFQSGKLFYLEYNIRLFWYLLFSKCDAICGIDLDTLGPSFLVSKMRNKKLIYDAHEYFTEVPEVVNRPLVKKIWILLEQMLVPKIQFAYTVCESIAEVFLEKYKTPFAVIRNVPFKRIETFAVSKTSPKVILYQGALNEGRGLEETITAMQSVKNAVLWLVGEGDLSQKLRDLVVELDLQDKVIFKGYLRPAELRVITPTATVGLNLLENKGLSYYYSLANKAFDYIQALVPSINMNFPEYQKLNKAFETSILLDQLEPGLISQAINELLTNQKLYTTLQSNCKKASEIYIWEEEEKKLISFYKSVFS